MAPFVGEVTTGPNGRGTAIGGGSTPDATQGDMLRRGNEARDEGQDGVEEGGAEGGPSVASGARKVEPLDRQEDEAKGDKFPGGTSGPRAVASCRRRSKISRL